MQKNKIKKKVRHSEKVSIKGNNNYSGREGENPKVSIILQIAKPKGIHVGADCSNTEASWG